MPGLGLEGTAVYKTVLGVPDAATRIEKAALPMAPWDQS